jgi:AraC-like DNA-binding protein
MNLEYFDTTKVNHLIEEYFHISFDKEDTPFTSRVLPIGLTHLFYIGSGKQKVIFDNREMPLEGIMITGQYSRSYNFFTNSITSSVGVSLHPTALYKLLNTDISHLENSHVQLKKTHPKFFNKILPVFKACQNPKDTIKNLNIFFLNETLTINKNTKCIDNVIEIIRDRNGILSINDILDHINISQKTLETQFKKIVGLTPGKYIRLYRFIKLMRKYESQKIDIKDLMFMFDYYDRSHFAKDFKLFMSETPQSYFKKDYPIIKAVFKNI